MPPAHRDRELAAALARRDPVAWQELLELHGGFLAGVARRACGDATRADDVVGEVFLALVREDCRLLRQFAPPYNLRALLAVVARRAATRHRPDFAPAADPLDPATEDEAPVDLLVRQERQAELRVAIAELPARERACVRLAFDEGLSQRGIAERAGMPIGSVGKTLARALDRLRGKVPSAR